VKIAVGTITMLLVSSVVTGCAGREEAEKTATLLSSIIATQTKASDAYATSIANYVNRTRALSASAIEIANRQDAETSVLASNLDLTGKGPATDIFKKHTTIRPAEIRADPLLSAGALKPWSPPSGDPDFEAAVKALKPIAAGESTEDEVSFFLKLVQQGRDQWEAQHKAAEAASENQGQ
jgi:hypothetical protein